MRLEPQRGDFWRVASRYGLPNPGEPVRSAHRDPSSLRKPRPPLNARHICPLLSESAYTYKFPSTFMAAVLGSP